MRRNRWFVLAAAVMLLAGEATAATVTLTAANAAGTSSFNTSLAWSDAAAPSAGNDYQNNGLLLRTPNGAAGNTTFAGNSLLITGPGLVATAGNEALLWKGANGATITVNNLTINGGQLRHAQGDVDTVTFAGNLAIGANGANFATQGGMIVSAPISGSSTIRILPAGNGDVRRLITLASGVNTFTGNLNMVNATQSRLTLADNANWNFVIGASGVNNTISGAGVLGLNGDFNINLSGAGSNLGDSWTLVSGPTTTYGATFTVAGFTNPIAGKWRSGLYVFDQATGVLSVTPVPEPATIALVGLALVGGVAAGRKRRMA